MTIMEKLKEFSRQGDNLNQLFGLVNQEGIYTTKQIAFSKRVQEIIKLFPDAPSEQEITKIVGRTVKSFMRKPEWLDIKKIYDEAAQLAITAGDSNLTGIIALSKILHARGALRTAEVR